MAVPAINEIVVIPLLISAAMSRPLDDSARPGDAELFHLRAQRARRQAQTNGRTAIACDHPVARSQNLFDVLLFHAAEIDCRIAFVGGTGRFQPFDQVEGVT